MPHRHVGLQIVVILLVVLAFFNVFPAAKAEPQKVVRKEGLYDSASDDVIILNEGNMNERVFGQDMVWVIEFYNSWCGHCIHFAPTWKSLASDLKGWRQVVSIGAIDCSSGGNLRMCRKFSIVAYPSVLLIPPNFTSDSSNSKVKTMKTRQKTEMKDTILDYIIHPQFPVPPSWPSLRPVKTVKEIQGDVKQRHVMVVIVFEEEQSTVGREVTLDLVDFRDILVRRMLKADVRKQGEVKYPSVYQVKEDSSTKHLISGTGDARSDRRRFVDHLLSLTGHLDSEGHRMKGEGQLKDQPGDEDKADLWRQQGNQRNIGQEHQGQPVRVYMEDLESALTYALRHEVALHSDIQEGRLDALRQFVLALDKYFPGQPPVMRLLHKLADHLQQVDVLTGEAWLSTIASVQDEDTFLPGQVHWVGCQGSHPRYRGYPCSLWTLFHVLTVAAYEKGEETGSRNVLLAIRGYMESFFGCDECTENFMKMAANLETKIRTPADAVLWLWMVHNKANKRLHGDVSEDPLHPKIQFPSARSCPKCRPQQDSDSDRVPWWNSSAVLAFLVKVYGRKNLIVNSSSVEGVHPVNYHNGQEIDWWKANQHEAALRKSGQLSQDVGFQSDQWGNRRKLVPDLQHFPMKGGIDMGYAGREWGVGRADVGLYAVFYVACVVIVVLLYYHFIVQKRSKGPCSKCPTV